MFGKPSPKILGGIETGTKKVVFKGLEPSTATVEDCAQALAILHGAYHFNDKELIEMDEITTKGNDNLKNFEFNIRTRPLDLEKISPHLAHSLSHNRDDFHAGYFVGLLAAHIPPQHRHVGYKGDFSTTLPSMATAINKVAEEMLRETTYEPHMQHYQSLHKISELQEGRAAQLA